ncbi:hypothetical protein P43SY_001302 [Pythium insidiosum]|uniref:SCP domain-containing protein n=1 Tax=Pythium insidiosum TaxID=114742 RepID=A0AAD5M3J6_PYTIN|nr:hypothetical protein P43SY_001302 [Pythium insidiosum]
MFGQRFALALVAAALVASDSNLVDAQRLRGLQSNDMYAKMLQAVNAERANANLPPLCYNSKLNNAAQAHSQDQANHRHMSHTGSNGSSMTERIEQSGFKWSTAAENVAAGQKSVEEVMDAWMHSDGHRRNILGDHKFFGVGQATANDDYGVYWTQNFGSGDEESCDGANESAVQPAPKPTPSAYPKPTNPPPQLQPQPKPGKQPEPKPTNPAQQPEPKPTNPAPQPQPKPANPAPHPQPKPQPQPTPAPQPKPEPTPAPQPKPVTPATPAPTKKHKKCKST